MDTATISQAQQLEQANHFQMYKRFPITFVRGEGSTLYDSEGKAYLDALAGIAVNSLGHSHPRLVKAIQDQAAQLIHVSNLYYTEPQGKLAQKLTEVSGMDRVFFCNSGAEANEGAIKLARKIGHAKGRKGHIVSMGHSFHGRTVATIALGQEKYQKGFSPMPGETRQAIMNDFGSVEALVDDDTVAIILEPVQGEGGIHPATKEFLEQVRALCDQKGMMLIFDEVQCGVGRIGTWYAWQHYGVQPDILTSAKALGGGFPIGAVLAKQEVAEQLQPGDHGTTYGGNPLACAASLAVLETIEAEGLLVASETKGAYLRNGLQSLQQKYPEQILEIRGEGLMVGAQMSFPCRELVGRMLKHGLLVSATADTVVRMVPPLVITTEEIDRLIQIFEIALKEELSQNG